MGNDKIIIDNQSDMDLVDALKQVRKIIKGELHTATVSDESELKEARTEGWN